MKRTTLALLVLVVVALAGCTKLGPTISISNPDNPEPYTCDFGEAKAACQASRAVRWMAALPLPVAIQVTEEHGHLAFVAPYSCPGTQTLKDFYACKIDAQWRYVSADQTVWLVSNGKAFGFNVATGKPGTATMTAEQVLALPRAQFGPITADPLPSTIGGLTGIPASQAMFTINDPGAKIVVEVSVGCLAGTEKVIPGKSVSHGAPDWYQTCGSPVLVAINY